MRVSRIIISMVFASGFLSPVQAHAAGGGSSDSNADNTPQCEDGQVYNKETKECEQQESILDHDSLFEAGRQLAYNGQYQKAITVLTLAPNQNDKRILNMLGYSNRKLGNLETGIAYYKHSIAVAPQYALVREYYGEALLQKGEVSAAKNQLAKIKQLCGDEICSSYQQLHAAIEAHLSGNPSSETTQLW